MKSQLIFLTIAIGSMLLSCEKEKPTEPGDTPTPDPVAPTTVGFHWKEDGGAYMTADSAKWDNFAEGSGIRVYKDGDTYFMEAIWTGGTNNTSVGNKTLKASDLNFEYRHGGDSYVITSNQTISITNFSNELLSGKCTISLFGSGPVKKIDAVFKDLPKRE